MATLAVPVAPSVSRRPLSTHGLPKPPYVTSPDRPHRFSGLGLPSSSTVSFSASPRSPGPMSPPMSARSFGTFIDSEPSTPAYSPRMDYDFDSSTLVLLGPTSSSSEPSSPAEPVWDMIAPTKRPHQVTGPFTTSHKEAPPVTKGMSVATRLVSPPLKNVKSFQKSKPLKEIKVADVSHKENEYPNEEEENEVKVSADHNGNTAAPFGKLASKMKLMLRRRSTNDTKKKEKKEKDYYDPVEDLHWTER